MQMEMPKIVMITTIRVDEVIIALAYASSEFTGRDGDVNMCCSGVQIWPASLL